MKGTTNATTSYKRTLRETAAANQTFAQQLTYLQTAYNSLTDDEKMNSVLVISDSLQVKINNISSGQFSEIHCWSNDGSSNTLIISTAKRYEYSISAKSVSDVSNQTNSGTLKLYA